MKEYAFIAGVIMAISTLVVGMLYFVGVITIGWSNNSSRLNHCEYVDGLVYSEKTVRTGNIYVTNPWSFGTNGYCEVKNNN